MTYALLLQPAELDFGWTELAKRIHAHLLCKKGGDQ